MAASTSRTTCYLRHAPACVHARRSVLVDLWSRRPQLRSDVPLCAQPAGAEPCLQGRGAGARLTRRVRRGSRSGTQRRAAARRLPRARGGDRLGPAARHRSRRLHEIGHAAVKPAGGNWAASGAGIPISLAGIASAVGWHLRHLHRVRVWRHWCHPCAGVRTSCSAELRRRPGPAAGIAHWPLTCRRQWRVRRRSEDLRPGCLLRACAHHAPALAYRTSRRQRLRHGSQLRLHLERRRWALGALRAEAAEA